MKMSPQFGKDTVDENSNSLTQDNKLNETRQKSNSFRGEDQVEAAATQIDDIKKVFKRKSKSSKRKKERHMENTTAEGNTNSPPSQDLVPVDPKVPKISSTGQTMNKIRRVFRLEFLKKKKEHVINKDVE